jgi:Arc/MetJ-type ribon-helix-helix transcriptional regulator
MKVKIPVTLSEELLPQIDQLTGRFGNRSAVIEKAIRDFLAVESKRRRDVEDMEILNRR